MAHFNQSAVTFTTELTFGELRRRENGSKAPRKTGIFRDVYVPILGVGFEVVRNFRYDFDRSCCVTRTACPALMNGECSRVCVEVLSYRRHSSRVLPPNEN